MEILISKRALNFLESLNSKDKERLKQKIKQYAKDPQSLAGNVKKLQAREGYRLRVGNYRILFDKNGAILHIIEIGHRGNIYG